MSYERGSAGPPSNVPDTAPQESAGSSTNRSGLRDRGAAQGPGTVQVRLPLAKPVLTYVLLGVNGVFFGLDWILSGVLLDLGAQVNVLVAAGQDWRLVSAMFLHAGLVHIAFNMWALFILGRDVEAVYGSGRFALIYFISGLAGNVAYYVLGPNDPSVGASGAIFGLVGAEVAYWLGNRSLFGSLSRQRLMNLLIVVVINLVYGFAGRGINNLAHIGGLLSGLALGLALVPRYRVAWDWSASGPAPSLEDHAVRWLQVAAVLGAILLLGAGILLGNSLWAARVPAGLG